MVYETDLVVVAALPPASLMVFDPHQGEGIPKRSLLDCEAALNCLPLQFRRRTTLLPSDLHLEFHGSSLLV